MGKTPLGRQFIEVPPAFFAPPSYLAGMHALDKADRYGNYKHPDVELDPVDRKYEELFHTIHSSLMVGDPGKALAAKIYDQLPMRHRGIDLVGAYPTKVRDEMHKGDLLERGRMISSRTPQELEESYARTKDRFYSSPQQRDRVERTYKVMKAVFDGVPEIPHIDPTSDMSLGAAEQAVKDNSPVLSALPPAIARVPGQLSSLLGTLVDFVVGRDQGGDAHVNVPYNPQEAMRAMRVPQFAGAGLNVDDV